MVSAINTLLTTFVVAFSAPGGQEVGKGSPGNEVAEMVINRCG